MRRLQLKHITGLGVRVFPPFLYILLASVVMALSASKSYEPYVVDLMLESKDLVSVVSCDVTKAPYSADKSGQSACTADFVAALSDAEVIGEKVVTRSHGLERHSARGIRA